MKLTVHIGTTKTGTSSIQRFLHGNRTALRKRGVLVPSGVGRMTHFHTVLAALPFGESPDLAQAVAVTDAASHEAFRARTLAAFQAERAAAPQCRDMVITAEQLQSRLPLTEHVESFRQLFCQGFDSVRILVYVRPQLDQLVSLYSTMLRGGYTETLPDFITSRMQPSFLPYFDLRHVITSWSGVFGAENVIVRPYKGISGELGTLSDFCDVLGIDPKAPGMVVDREANISINLAGQELLLMLNRAVKMDAPQRRRLAKWAETHCAGKGAMPTLQQAQAFQATYADSNAWVIANHFPDHPEYLEPRWPKK